MTAEQYIQSGAIESCIMGLATEADWQELEQMMLQYPEVRAAKDAFDEKLEQENMAQAIDAPLATRQQIFHALQLTEDPELPATVVALPENTAAQPSLAKTIPITAVPKSIRWFRRAVAACFILLMGSVLLNFYYYSQSVSHKNEYDALLLKQNSLLAKNQALETGFNKVKDPMMKPVLMKATDVKQGCMATVYWDMRSKDVYLLVNHLPKPTSGKQYQLWAIVKGAPVSAGMLNMEDTVMLHKMSNIPQAEAFAISLEKTGGAAAPTMEEMYVMGKL